MNEVFGSTAGHTERGHAGAGAALRVAVLTLLVCSLSVVVALVEAKRADAATGFERVGAFAEAFPDGQPAHQHRIAVRHATGDVYVTDVVNDRIDVYRPNGDSADALTTFGTGQLTDPFGIAIDQSNGDVYVADDSHVVRFANDGSPTPSFALDPTFTSPAVTGPLAFDQTAGEAAGCRPGREPRPPLQRHGRLGRIV